jgi:hypothetical protein
MNNGKFVALLMPNFLMGDMQATLRSHIAALNNARSTVFDFDREIICYIINSFLCYILLG